MYLINDKNMFLQHDSVRFLLSFTHVFQAIITRGEEVIKLKFSVLLLLFADLLSLKCQNVSAIGVIFQ